MAKKYEEKKKFHAADKPKEESAKEKVLKSVMSHGKKFVEKSKKRAMEEAARQGKKQKSKKRVSGTRQTDSPRPQGFSFGFGGNMENFGYDMFRPRKESTAEPKPFDFGFNSDYDKLFDFRPKKKKSSMNDIWNPEDFWR